MGVRQFSLLAVIAATILTCGKCQMGLNDTLCQLLGPQVPGGIDDSNRFFIGSLPNPAMYDTEPITVFIAGNPAETVILQVRRTDQNCPVGTFSLTMGQQADGLTGFSCGAASNTVASTQAISFPQALQLSWTPPTYNAGSLAIYGRFTDGTDVLNLDGLNIITPATTIEPVQTIGIEDCPPDGTGSTFTPPSCTRGGNVIGPAVCTPDSNLQTGDTVECTCMDCNTVTCSFTVNIATAPCSPDPCQNGATCFEIPPTTFFCNCQPGFTGLLCEVPLVCNPNPCDNGGTCVVNNGAPSCICPPVFTGPTCNVPVPDCNPNPCDNGGICVVNNGVLTCICLPGFTGPTCNDVIPACSADTCDNGGTCIITNGEAVCICPPGFTGPTCAVPVVVGPACLPNPCMGGAECRPDAGLAGYTCHTSVGVPCM